MQFRPGFDQPALPARQAARKQLNGIDRENPDIVPLVRVKVWNMVRPPSSTYMRMTMPKHRLISGTVAFYRQRRPPALDYSTCTQEVSCGNSGS